MKPLDIAVFETAIEKYGHLSVSFSFTIGATSPIVTVRHNYDNALIAEVWHNGTIIKVKQFIKD